MQAGRDKRSDFFCCSAIALDEPACHQATLLAKALQHQSANSQLKKQHLSLLSFSWSLLLPPPRRNLQPPIITPLYCCPRQESTAVLGLPVQFWAEIHTHPAPTRDLEKASNLIYGRSRRYNNNNWMKVCHNRECTGCSPKLLNRSNFHVTIQ